MQTGRQGGNRDCVVTLTINNQELREPKKKKKTSRKIHGPTVAPNDALGPTVVPENALGSNVSHTVIRNLHLFSSTLRYCTVTTTHLKNTNPTSN